ncbi:MAG: site-specific DNA-methyltransferase [Rhodobiaceae bacterium]|nr:site-specific DNA-methyltransferase [Rhodobiaceae bacterium]
MALMRSFVRHVCPPGGVVLDPFAGTGTTLRAAVLEDRRAIGIEADAASVVDTVWRMRHATQPE